MDIRPIRTEADYEAALATVERLLGAPVGTPEGDLLDVLVVLVEAYEEKNYPFAPAGDAIDTLKYLMKENGRTQSDLAGLFGSRSRASEVLNRRRSLTLEQIKLLQNQWGVPAGLLIREEEHA